MTDDSPTPVIVPLVLNPVEVRVPLVSDIEEIRDVRIAARMLPLGAIVSDTIRATILRDALGIVSYVGSKILQYRILSSFIFLR